MTNPTDHLSEIRERASTRKTLTLVGLPEHLREIEADRDWLLFRITELERALIETGKGDEPKSVIGPMCSHCGLSMVQFAPAEGNLIGGWACPSMGLHPISAPSAAPAVEADVRSLVLSCLAHTGMKDEDASRILAEIDRLTAKVKEQGELIHDAGEIMPLYVAARCSDTEQQCLECDARAGSYEFINHDESCIVTRLRIAADTGGQDV